MTSMHRYGPPFILPSAHLMAVFSSHLNGMLSARLYYSGLIKSDRLSHCPALTVQQRECLLVAIKGATVLQLETNRHPMLPDPTTLLLGVPRVEDTVVGLLVGNTRLPKLVSNNVYYRLNPGACIRKILDDTPPIYCTIPEADLVNHFTSTDAPPPPISDPPSWLVSLDSHEDVLATPFTPYEMLHQQQRAKKTAPGSDKLTYANWKWADPEGVTLATIFNICRGAGRIPPDWKGSTVTLLPKGGDPMAVRNWRPICLQKTIYKLYSAAIARRIADWAITAGSILPSQKGFLPYDGCAEHSFVLRSALNDSRRRKRNIVLAWLDLRDAFGSVSHDLLLLMMSRLGLTGKTIDIVTDIYTDATVAIKTGRDSYTANIAQRRGVKQGCPLSPLLFNIALEGLLRHLKSCSYGFPISGTVLLNHLAYADDVCILAGWGSSPSRFDLASTV